MARHIRRHPADEMILFAVVTQDRRRLFVVRRTRALDAGFGQREQMKKEHTRYLFTAAYSSSRATKAHRSWRFLLDLRANLTDNYSVETATRLIYSPSDMPQGLWRGFAFGGRPAEGVCRAC